jgi:hypothetical protein
MYLVDTVELTSPDGSKTTQLLPSRMPDLQSILNTEKPNSQNRSQMMEAELDTPFQPTAESDGLVTSGGSTESEDGPSEPLEGGGDLEDMAALSVGGRLPIIDEKGRALARGRRKESSARVWIWHGVGDISVNGKPFSKYFSRAAHRAAVLKPVNTLWMPEEFTIRASVEGGGAPSCSFCFFF